MAASRLILVRHAHADWPDYRGPDFDRPLTPRGLAAAKAAAIAIRDAGHRPVLLLASPAMRTRQTAQILASELQLPASALRFLDSLYNASAVTLEAEARVAAAMGSVIGLVAHNPGVTELVRALAGEAGASPMRPADWLVLPLR